MKSSDDYRKMSRAELIQRLLALESESGRSAPQPPGDYALLQELAVHQEEVRAQNAQLREMQHQIELSRDRYAELYDFAPLAYATLDSRGVICDINLTGATLLGVERQHLIGHPLSAFIHPEDLDRFLEHLRNARQSDRDVSAEMQLHSKGDSGDTRDGGDRSFPAQLTTHLVRNDATETVELYRTAITDMSKHRRAEQERQSALLRANAAFAAAETKDRLIAMVSHELRTPLSAILLWAKILQIKLSAQPEQAHALEVIVRSADAQRQLIDDLLDISRISSGKMRLDLKQVALGSLLAAAVETVLPAARVKGIQIESDLRTEIGALRADPDRLQQVLTNLLSNAIKFTPAGGRVRVSAQRVGDELDLRVSDTGQGIDAELLPHVFEPFRQAESAITTRSHGGLGLGLAISKQLIEQHSGSIHVMSEGLGKGATFAVRLPLPPRAEAVSAPNAEGPPSQLASQSDLNAMNVLLVEDETATRTALVTLLAAAGAQVLAVDNAQAAIETFQRARPHAIVGDIGMPGMDGYQMMQRLRALEKVSGEPPVPAIALTAFASATDSARARAAGFDLHMAKPVDPGELLAALQQLTRSADRLRLTAAT